MICDCGRPLEPYIVEVDGEQYVEDLCPQCAFSNPPSAINRLTLDSNDVSNLTLNVDQSLILSGNTGPASITGSFSIDMMNPAFFGFDDICDIKMTMGNQTIIIKECSISGFAPHIINGVVQHQVDFIAKSVEYV